MSQRPWFPLYVAEYRADTHALTLEEHGAYLLLLMHAWSNDGIVPADGKRRNRILGVHHHRGRLLWQELERYFVKLPEGYRSKRLDKEIAKALEISEKRRQAVETRYATNAPTNEPTNVDTPTPTPTPTDIDLLTNVSSGEPPRKNGGGTPFPPTPFEKIQTDYNSLASEVGLPQCRLLTATRKKHIAARWREYPDLESWTNFWGYVKAQPFLSGQNDRGWRCDIEWLMKPNNFAKVLEGSYIR